MCLFQALYGDILIRLSVTIFIHPDIRIKAHFYTDLYDFFYPELILPRQESFPYCQPRILHAEAKQSRELEIPVLAEGER